MELLSCVWLFVTPWTVSPPGSSVHGIFQARILAAAAAATKSHQSCPTLCDTTDGSLPGCSVPGILQARILEWVAISLSNSWNWKVSEVAQSYPTLSDPMDCSLPGSSIHGIFRARVLEWVAIAFSVKTHYYLSKKPPIFKANFIYISYTFWFFYCIFKSLTSTLEF